MADGDNDGMGYSMKEEYIYDSWQHRINIDIFNKCTTQLTSTTYFIIYYNQLLTKYILTVKIKSIRHLEINFELKM